MVRLILASGSKARAEMLDGAGVAFAVVPADIDEQKIMRDMLQQNAAPETVATALAQAKALHVAQQNPGAAVIGADQVLWFNGRIFSKAKDIPEARSNLQAFRGNTHSLISAVCVAQDGKVLWQDVARADLAMRKFDDAFLDGYMGMAGDALLKTVGGYELENAGKMLFEKVEGDYFTVLGMPLLPLLEFLRGRKWLKNSPKPQ